MGQRKGLGVSSNERLYVLDVAATDRTVTVGPESELYSSALTAARCNWLAIDPPSEAVRVEAQIRHRHAQAAATVTPADDGTYRVEFDDAQRAVAPGQGVAFYSNGLLLGGGWIAAATR